MKISQMAFTVHFVFCKHCILLMAMQTILNFSFVNCVFRKCKLVTQGPWVSVGPPELSSLSLQVDRPATPTQPIVLWAIGANGDVLCRDGITQAHPMVCIQGRHRSGEREYMCVNEGVLHACNSGSNCKMGGGARVDRF